MLRFDKGSWFTHSLPGILPVENFPHVNLDLGGWTSSRTGLRLFEGKRGS